MDVDWIRPKEAAKYAGVSKRTLASWFKAGLRRSKVGGVVLVKRTDLDNFIQRFSESGSELDRVVNEVVGGLTHG